MFLPEKPEPLHYSVKLLMLLWIICRERRTNAIAMLVNLLIAFGNIINLSASILIVSAHSLIAFWKAIRLSPRIFIASTLPSDTTCSLTVPGGDTPCVTAGDARRANPWESEKENSDAAGVAQHPQHLLLVFIFCCHAVTLSHFEYTYLRTFIL